MTEKENVLHALRHDGKAEWIANITDSVRFFTVPQSRDKVKEGLDWFGVRWRDFSPLNEPLFEDISEWKERVVFPDLEDGGRTAPARTGAGKQGAVAFPVSGPV